MSAIDTHTLPSDFLHGISASSFASVLACWAWNSSSIFLVASFRAWFASFSWTFNAFLSFTASFSFWMTVGSQQGVLTQCILCCFPRVCIHIFASCTRTIISRIRGGICVRWHDGCEDDTVGCVRTWSENGKIQCVNGTRRSLQVWIVQFSWLISNLISK